MGMNPNNRPQDKFPYLQSVSWRLTISLGVLAILAIVALVLNSQGYFFSNNAQAETTTGANPGPLSARSEASKSTAPEMQAAALPDIVDAIEAGQVEELVVIGDQLVATTANGASLSAKKESTISALETLRLLGVSDRACQLPSRRRVLSPTR
jgi:hypothetical protein